MTKQETAMIMALLQAAYPSFYRGQSEADAKNAVLVWADMFADDDFNEVCAAVKMLIATRVEGYPPTIGAVKEKLSQLHHPDELDAQSAWALAAKAAAGNLKWDKLPPMVQAAVGSQNILREWGLMDADEFNTVVYSQFVKAYKIHRQREREWEATPNDIKQLASSLAGKLDMPDIKQLGE